MNETKTIFVMLTMAMAAVAFAPTASADHGDHECTAEDPCDNQGNQGCSGTGVTCSYEGHDSCYGSGGSDQKVSCNHYSRDCLVNIRGVCEVHGSTPVLRTIR